VLTGPTLALAAGVAPPAFDAVTTTRTAWPTSEEPSVYEEAVALLTFEHDSPAALQSCHW
jgi:hypothetical protein